MFFVFYLSSNLLGFTRGKLFTQHDGRVGISGVNENIINNCHPGLVSGSLLILGW